MGLEYPLKRVKEPTQEQDDEALNILKKDFRFFKKHNML